MKKRYVIKISLTISLTMLIICALGMFLIACGKKSEETTEGKEAEKEENLSEETYTVMVYMMGSDLEASSGAGAKDIEEMIGSGIDNSKVKLYLYTGGCPKWRSEEIEISNEENTIFQYDGTTFVKEKVIEQASMGEAATLSEYLNYVYENSKTDKYIAIL